MNFQPEVGIHPQHPFLLFGLRSFKLTSQCSKDYARKIIEKSPSFEERNGPFVYLSKLESAKEN